MGALSRRLPGALILSVVMFGLWPAAIDRQDLGAHIARSSGVEARLRDHLVASTFGSVRASVFVLPQPGVPLNWVHMASIDRRDPGLTPPFPTDRNVGAVEGSAPLAPLFYPSVNRSAKGDFLAARPPVEAFWHTEQRADETFSARFEPLLDAVFDLRDTHLAVFEEPPDDSFAARFEPMVDAVWLTARANPERIIATERSEDVESLDQALAALTPAAGTLMPVNAEVALYFDAGSGGAAYAGYGIPSTTKLAERLPEDRRADLR
jgi:hypothetical protein